MTGFAPHVLREYALLADGERGALCGPRGDIAWLCAPGWSDSAVLSSLIGGTGSYTVSPAETCVWGGYYEPGTLIWRNRWVTTSTAVECRDALAYPGDPHHVVLLRRVEAVERDVRVRVRLDLADGFGRRSLRELRRHDDGTWTGRTGDLRVRWTGAGDATPSENGLGFELTVPAGGHHDLVLEIGGRLPDPVDVESAWLATETAWHRTVPELKQTVAPRDAQHAYAVLRGLTTRGGGMVAAATLGLPERSEAGRNYDYRYVWLRDQCYAGLAAAVDEPHPLLDDALRFSTARVLDHGDRLLPAYRTDGTPPPDETTLKLPGYPGGSDVVGNHVAHQFQLDALGELLQLHAAAARHGRFDGDVQRASDVVVRLITERWDQPEAGVWELEDDWWTHSRLACVAGLNALAREVPAHHGARLSGLADKLLAETTSRCLDARGFWRRGPAHTGTDSALLLPPVRGALPADDPRTRATLDAVRENLTEDGYVYRFAPDERPLGEAEGAFLLCGFTMALAYAHQGERTEAFRWFERNRAACGPPGLLAEEYDVRQRQLRGNLPQAFVHAMLLEAAQRLS
ncbi:Glucoamylase (glucan-1,4-alpha-glucosidase), GH15 family [Amycolatopsis pretoriensis]|uniref:Glucoamylase (Glucan-1,4-alpha-glucosidase), GH15 family n=3 Tax=Amycolatopsis pretoriensis TaxID=218821 RepID=A0A1H5Q0T8_9PSEU|nr:glycoside hydrolase family 15 protein [Amycolatopsis pretoriensis]SEF19666.1 Glucoamylase (glucan-1,4-alpha-glucosidase), GH15 family [Amycolatopsis pretoriensis]